MTASGGSGPVERLRTVPVALPCAVCVKRDVCAIRPRLEATVFAVPVSEDEGVTITGSFAVTCRFARTDRGHVGPALKAAWTPERRAAQSERLRLQRAKGEVQ